jgi:hypothetical protein
MEEEYIIDMVFNCQGVASILRGLGLKNIIMEAMVTDPMDLRFWRLFSNSLLRYDSITVHNVAAMAFWYIW